MQSKPNETRDAKPVKVTVSLPSELVQQLDEHAAQERRTRSNALRLLLETALQSTRRAG